MNMHASKHPAVVALFVLIVGVMLMAPSGTADARDRGINQPGAAGNRGADPRVGGRS